METARKCTCISSFRVVRFQEDHLLVECLDPETLKPGAVGQPGELISTTLTKEERPGVAARRPL